MARFPPELVHRVNALLRTSPEGHESSFGDVGPCRVHEWFAAVDAGGSHGEWIAPHGVLVALAWKMLRTSPPTQCVAWVGRRVWPSPRSLVAVDGSRELLARSIFVRTDSSSCMEERANRVWAAQQSLACDDVAAVIWDSDGFDMVASRRMQLAASRDQRRPPVLALCARPWSQRNMPTAASTRWVVHAHPCDGSDATGVERNPAWRAELVRGRGSLGAVVGERESIYTATWSWKG